jgi:hypothetical protein
MAPDLHVCCVLDRDSIDSIAEWIGDPELANQSG